MYIVIFQRFTVVTISVMPPSDFYRARKRPSNHTANHALELK